MNRGWWLTCAAAALAFVSLSVAQNDSLPLKPVVVDQFDPSAEGAEFAENNPHRIVGGRPISIQAAPYQVAVILDRQLTCGGSIISSYWVLTAAHCVTGTIGDVRVRGGTRYFKSGGQTRQVVLVVRNGGYNANSGAADIAMLRVKKPFTFNSRLRPVQLATRNMRLPVGFVISGWGITSESSFAVRRGLRGTTVGLVPRRSCLRQYQGRLTVPLRMFCASSPGRDSCSGDSGGAIVSGNVQYGIVAFGDGCARPNSPGVYTDVRLFRRWISLVAQRYQSYAG